MHVRMGSVVGVRAQRMACALAHPVRRPQTRSLKRERPTPAVCATSSSDDPGRSSTSASAAGQRCCTAVLFGACRQRQALPRATRLRGRVGRPRSFLDDDVSVGAAETERAHSGNATLRALLPVAARQP